MILGVKPIRPSILWFFSACLMMTAGGCTDHPSSGSLDEAGSSPSTKDSRVMFEEKTGNDFITVNVDLCAHCDRCIRVCRNDVIERRGRGADVGLCFDAGVCLRESRCTGCGDCVAVCPTGALRRADLTASVMWLGSERE